MTDNEFLARLCGDIEKLESIGFRDREIARMLKSLDYVRIWTMFPTFIDMVAGLPKGYKISDGETYKRKGDKKSDAERYDFVPVGDDLYIRGALKMKKKGEHSRREWVVVKNYRELTATEVKMGICKTKCMPFFEDSLLKFYHAAGLKIMDNAPVPDGLFPEYGKRGEDAGLDVGFRVLKLV